MHAETLYRQIGAVEPRQPEALHMLGLLSHSTNCTCYEEAVDLIEQAIALMPDDGVCYSNLCEVLRFSAGLKRHGQPASRRFASRNLPRRTTTLGSPSETRECSTTPSQPIVARSRSSPISPRP